MAYGVKEDKTKANIVVYSHTFSAVSTSGELEYTGSWDELSALGVDAQDFSDGKWVILSCYQENHKTNTGKRFDTMVLSNNIAYPRATFLPDGEPFVPDSDSFTLKCLNGYGGYGSTCDVTVYVVLMKIA